MVLSYWDEIDLSQTKYDDNWKSKKLETEPTYTEEMQAIDRWCKRRLELYKNQALNAVVEEQNERERQRRNRIRKALRLHIENSFGDNVPENVSDLKDYAYSEAPKKPSINQDFDEDWMDEDLKKRDLYHPCMELMKQWLKLYAIESTKKLCDKLREQYIAEELLSVITYEKEDQAMDLAGLCDEYDDEL